MPLNNIDLTPYELTAIHHSDNFLIHYDAVDDDGKSYIITEFFPAYMVDRLEWGDIEASPRFAEEYDKAKQLFLDKALAMKQMSDISIPRIENVVERNNTAYIIRKVINYPTLDNYMGTNRMPYEEAYAFIRPLLLTLVQAEQHGLMFVFEDGDMRVNRYGQLLIDAVFDWEAPYTATITLLAKLFYRLVHGQAHNAQPPAAAPRMSLNMDMDEDGEPTEAAPIKEPDALMPPRLEAMIREILNGGVLFGALDDFNKNFKFVMEMDRKKASSTGNSNPMMSVQIMRWVVVVLSVALIGAIILLVTNVILPLHRAAHPDLTDPALIHTPEPARTVAPQLRNYSGFSATNPADDSDILNGLCYEQDGVMYYRAYDGEYYLAKRGPDGEEKALVLEVRPTFITVYDNRVYFSDGLTDYRLMRVDTDGKNPFILTDEPAMFPFMDGEWLYYTNHNDRDRLYRMNPITGESAPYLKQAAYETVPFGERLFFINGDNRYHLYVADHAPEHTTDHATDQTTDHATDHATDQTAAYGEAPRWRAVNEMSSENLRINNRRLYFLDVADGEIYSIGTDERITAAGWPAAYMFDISDTWLVMIEDSTNLLRAFNRVTGEELPLPYQQASYVKIAGNTIVFADYGDSKVVSRIQLP